MNRRKNQEKKILGLRAKTYSYLIDDGSKDKKACRKKVCHKIKLNLKIIKSV